MCYIINTLILQALQFSRTETLIQDKMVVADHCDASTSFSRLLNLPEAGQRNLFRELRSLSY